MSSTLVNLGWTVFSILIFALFVAVIIWLADKFGWAFDETIKKILWALVAVYAIVSIGALLLGFNPPILRPI